MKNKLSFILPLLVAPVLAGCVYNNGISEKKDYTITGVKVDPTSLEFSVGDEAKKVTPTIEGTGEYSNEYLLSVSDASKVEVSAEGGVSGTGFDVKPLAEGNATISIVAKGDSTKKATVEVTIHKAGEVVKVTGVSFDKTEASIVEKTQLQLVATVAPENATNKLVRYESSDQNIATVDEKGLVSAVGLGNCQIKVTTVDGGFTALCAITVTKDEALVEGSYYLSGSLNEWMAKSTYVLKRNASSLYENEYYVRFNAQAGDIFKVAKYNGTEGEKQKLDYYEPNITIDPSFENNIGEFVEDGYGGHNIKITTTETTSFVLYFVDTPTNENTYKYYLAVDRV